jgi:hypothetical protein
VCENFVKTYRKRLTSVIANKGCITKYWAKLLLLTKYLFSTINSLKILQCDFLDFFLILSVIVEVYLWWKLQASRSFLSGRTCTIGGWLNTFLPHCIILTFQGHGAPVVSLTDGALHFTN